MAGLVPAIHALSRGAKNVDARDEPGHDDLWIALLVPRTLRSTKSAFTRGMLMRCRAGAHLAASYRVAHPGPRSAQRHYVPQRVRDTRL
jgi:hypothetical protein